MTEYIVGFALMVLAFVALSLQRLYSVVPAHELKRLAGREDQLAKRLHRVTAYGTSLRLLLWIITGSSLAASFLLLIPGFSPVAAFILLAIVLAALFVWLPSLQLTVRLAHFAVWFVPSLVWLLSKTHPFLNRLSGWIGRYRELMPHSRLYEKEDFHRLLGLQKEQADNRIAPQELELIERALRFGDQHAADIAIGQRKAHLVSADDTIGPVLLDQLHKHRQQAFFVYKDDPEHIIGSLSMSDARSAKQGGRVLDLVRSDLTYVHEDYSLHEVLSVFQESGQQIVLVINSFEEFVGQISFEALIRELLGELESPPVSHGDRSAVAESAKRIYEDKSGKMESPSPEATGVIE